MNEEMNEENTVFSHINNMWNMVICHNGIFQVNLNKSLLCLKDIPTFLLIFEKNTFRLKRES